MLQNVTNIFTILVALEAFFIMIIEIFASNSKIVQRAFNLPFEYLNQRETKISMANQGLYNGFIGFGILSSLFFYPTNLVPYGLFLFIGFVIVAAVYGAITVNKKIIVTQGGLAIICFVLMIFNYLM